MGEFWKQNVLKDRYMSIYLGEQAISENWEYLNKVSQFWNQNMNYLILQNELILKPDTTDEMTIFWDQRGTYVWSLHWVTNFEPKGFFSFLYMKILKMLKASHFHLDFLYTAIVHFYFKSKCMYPMA